MSSCLERRRDRVAGHSRPSVSVHGAAGSWLEHPGRRPRGRSVANVGRELGSRLQDLPQRRGRRVRRAARSSGRSRGHPVSVPGRALPDSRPAARERQRSRSPPSAVGRRRRSRASCAATAAPAGPTGRSRLTIRPSPVEPARTDAAWKPTQSCASWSPAGVSDAGAHHRSPVACAPGFLTGRRFGCVTRASTR